jgi:putative nucleotidyltransferase with HDIG domain
MPQTILFVDSERFVHKALQRSFRDMRDQWRIRFAANPDEGLALMACETVDVVITEMVFAGGSGHAFLEAVRDRYPQTVRIILSGYVDRNIILNTVDLAHQFLSKPCDDTDLKTTIARAILIKDLLANEALKQVVARTDSLPSLPALYLELMETLNSNEASIQTVGELLAGDLGLVTKLLKLVNSSYFGFSQRIVNPVKAVGLLGLDLIQAFVLAAGIFDHFKRLKMNGIFIEQMWTHAMTTAAIAKIIAQASGMDRKAIDSAFMAGMLHDIGKLLMAVHLAESYKAVIRYMKRHQCDMVSAEMPLLGTTHAAVGAYLLGLWGLPDAIIDAVAYHHFPALKAEQGFGTVAIAHIADAFANQSGALRHTDHLVDGLDYIYLEQIKMRDHIPAWRILCVKES